MDENQRVQLLSSNKIFYQQAAESFAATRQKSWSGWQFLPVVTTPRVLDVACGNGRFVQYLTKQYSSFSYLGCDASRPLLEQAAKDIACQNLARASITFEWLDVLACYQRQRSWTQLLPAHNWSLVVCFGFFHHIPGQDWRERFLLDLWSQVEPGGYLAVSFWQFMPTLRRLVCEDLGDNDYLLSWQNDPQLRRYAHHLTADEITALDQLIVGQQGEKWRDFHADGPKQQLNHYFVWHKSG